MAWMPATMVLTSSTTASGMTDCLREKTPLLYYHLMEA